MLSDLSWIQWTGLVLCAVLIGVSKSGLPGMGILAVPLFAAILPARASTGALLPILIIGDAFAVAFYRRHAVWRHLIPLLPWAVAGVVIGAVCMQRLSDAQLRPVIGTAVLIVIGAGWLRDRRPSATDAIAGHWGFAAVFGLLAGVTTMMANAAGPIMVVYLLAMGLPKNEFIGTGAWYYLLVNCIKVPFHILMVGTITGSSLLFSISFLPAVAVGALLGVRMAQRMPQKLFNTLVQVLAAAAALKLLF